MSSTTTLVSTAAELKTVLTAATGGETILLKAGVNFGGAFNIPWGINPAHSFTSTVTIKSEDVNNQAIFNSIAQRCALELNG